MGKSVELHQNSACGREYAHVCERACMCVYAYVGSVCMCVTMKCLTSIRQTCSNEAYFGCPKAVSEKNFKELQKAFLFQWN